MANVTDVDREAAVNHHRSVGRRALAGGITAGAFDNDTLVQQFARHREEATRELEARDAGWQLECEELREEKRELVEALDRIADPGTPFNRRSVAECRSIARQVLAKHTGGE